MTDLNDNRLIRAFSKLRSCGQKTLAPFITAGFPDVETTGALLVELESRGVRICELGIPFSDPIADGPVIQNSYTDALEGGMDSDKVFGLVTRYRDGGGAMGLVAMVSYSIVFRHGVDEYLSQTSDAGFDGVIIPDLPLEEAGTLEPLAASHGLANIMLIAPTTPPARRIAISRHCRGFAYVVSVAGITGERDELPEQTIRDVAELRNHTDVPICVGFGISKPEMVRAVCEVADGAIVGSAIVHRIADSKDLPRDQLVNRIGDFVGQLLAPLNDQG